MPEFKVQWDYASGFGAFDKGSTVELDQELADAINVDSPGVLEPVKGRQKPATGGDGPPSDRAEKSPRSRRSRRTTKGREGTGGGEGAMTAVDHGAVKKPGDAKAEGSTTDDSKE